ncbi:hypothetical protein B9Z55_000351 [Caenorhabditis nigoni]|uniref:Uncharacterized protein n=1 Tax=Caenorhabditis nigoni TaxID=1611254 RepID=A0A2G5VR23_9PELO|nr:hypothetical protein B9Z55_000351 [Caenorhabditis nigoni]
MSKSAAKPPRPPPRTRGRPPAQKPAAARKPRSRTSKSGPASPTKSQESLTSPEPPSRPNRAAAAAESRSRSPRRSVSARESKPRSCRIDGRPQAGTAASVSVTGTPRMSLEEPEEVPKAKAARRSRKADVSRPSDGPEKPESLIDTTEVTLDSPGSSSWIPTEAVRAISLTGSNSPQIERVKSPEGPPELPDSTPMESEGVRGSPGDPIGARTSDTSGGSPTVLPARSRSRAATLDQRDPIGAGTSDARGESSDTVPPTRSRSIANSDPADPIDAGASDTRPRPETPDTVPPARSKSIATRDQGDPIAVGTSDTRGGSPEPQTTDTVPPARSQSPDPMLEEMPETPPSRDPIHAPQTSQESERFRESSPQAPEKPYWQVLQEQDPHQMVNDDEERDQDRYYRDRLEGRYDDEEGPYRDELSSRSEASGSSDEEPPPKAYDPFEEERPDSPSWRQRAAAHAALPKKHPKVRKIKKGSRDIPSGGAPEGSDDEDQERIPKKVRRIQKKNSRDPPDDYDDDDQKTPRIHSPARPPLSDNDDDDPVTLRKKALKIQKKPPRRSPTPEDVVPEDVRPEDVVPEAPFGDPDDKIRLMLEVESGNDSDYDEAEDRALWDEPNKRE